MSLSMTVDQERQLARYLAHRHAEGAGHGMSADAMLTAVLKGETHPEWLPADVGDLGRCIKTFLEAPAFLQEHMEPILKLGQRAVLEGGLYCRECDEFGKTSLVGHKCRKCDTEAHEHAFSLLRDRKAAA